MITTTPQTHFSLYNVSLTCWAGGADGPACWGGGGYWACWGGGGWECCWGGVPGGGYMLEVGVVKLSDFWASFVIIVRHVYIMYLWYVHMIVCSSYKSLNWLAIRTCCGPTNSSYLMITSSCQFVLRDTIGLDSIATSNRYVCMHTLSHQDCKLFSLFHYTYYRIVIHVPLVNGFIAGYSKLYRQVYHSMT